MKKISFNLVNKIFRNQIKQSLSNHFSLLLALGLATSIFTHAQLTRANQNQCIELFQDQLVSLENKLDSNSKSEKNKSEEIKKVVFDYKEFRNLFTDLRKTITGNLATVWRSEWKIKLSPENSNTFIFGLLNQNLTKKTMKAVIEGLNPNDEGFVRKVHRRIYDLQKTNQLQEGDTLSTRDPPPPKGVTDTTFTYYTKPIRNNLSSGKHQVRIRTYLRKINFSKIPESLPIEGYLSNGQKISIIKNNSDQFQITEKNQVRYYNYNQITQTYGEKLLLHAPHGKAYKLEIKTATDDLITSFLSIFKKLTGQHIVQKLDVSLSFDQFNSLFKGSSQIDINSIRTDSLEKIFELENELIETEKQSGKPKYSEERIKSVMAFLKQSVIKNPKFLEIEGATTYHRTAFESTTGFQVTVDRNQGVYFRNMYRTNELGRITDIKSPVDVTRENKKRITGKSDSRHVEFKLPINILSTAVGVKFAHADDAQLVSPIIYDDRLVHDSLTLFAQYVKNKKHAGKFNYIKEEFIAEEIENIDTDDY